MMRIFPRYICPPMANEQDQNRTYKSRVGRLTANNLPANTLGKLPPQALDLEEAVLGALMLEKDALSAVIDILKPDIFYHESHQKIFDAIRRLFEKSQPVDILTVTAEMRQQGTLEVAGGAFYISELTNKVASAANIEFHARILAQKYIQRELIRISTEITTSAYEDTSDVFDILDKAEQNLFSIAENNLRRSSESMSDLLRQAIEQVEKLKDREDGLTGVPSGFTKLDEVTSGWQKSDLIIVAARPGMGKTAFVLSVARNAAVDFSKAVAIFSLEMSSVQLVNRLISGEAELESGKLRKGNLADYEWKQLHSKIGKLSEAPIFIDDTPALNIFELRAKCRRLKSQHDIQMIIVDYLQLMTANSEGKGGNREQEIGSISRALKSLAKELNVPVIALSQLSRAVETRGGDKKPQLSDLRESGSIEQDADMVVFLYRPDYYGITQDADGNNTAGIGEVIIAKHRNGSLETVPLRFIDKFVKFTNLDSFGNYGMPASDDPFRNIAPSTQFGQPNTIIRPSKMNEWDDSAHDDAPPF